MKAIWVGLLFAMIMTVEVFGAAVTWEYPPLRCPETFDSCRIFFNHNCDSAGTALLTDTNAIYFSRATSDTSSNSFDALIYYQGYTKPVSFSDWMQNSWPAISDTIDWRPWFYWAESPDTAIMTTIIDWTDTIYDTVLAESCWLDTVSVLDNSTVQVTSDLNYWGEWVSGSVLHYDCEHTGVGSATSSSYCRAWGTIVDGIDSLGEAKVIFAFPSNVKQNSCDSTWIGRREKHAYTEISGESHHLGYFEIDVPWSSCLDDKKYTITVKWRGKELIRNEPMTIPDSSSYRLW